MRKFFIVAAAIAAASCGGNQSNLSKDQAESVSSQIADALSAARPDPTSGPAASAANLLAFSINVNVTRSCPAGGSLSVQGPVSINCPAGIFSCAYSGSLTVTANECTTIAGATINGTLKATVSGTGLNFTVTATGTLDITVDGTTTTCNVNVTLMPGSRISSICGIAIR